jgi:tetratricopeptide (TPR) repeat protein
MIQHEARMGRFDQVEHWAALAGKSSTAPARVSEVAGRALLSAGQPALALPHLQRARALGVRSPDTLADLAQAAIARGDPGAAVEALGSIVWPGDAHARPLARAGRLAAMAGAYDLAEGLLVQAVDRQPDLADAWAQLGFARLFAKRFDAAAPALEEAVRLNPSDAVAHGGLAVCELQLGKRDLALRRARAALAIDADEPLARQVVAALGGS